MFGTNKLYAYFLSLDHLMKIKTSKMGVLKQKSISRSELQFYNYAFAY